MLINCLVNGLYMSGFVQNRLSLNSNKTKFIIFTGRKRKYDYKSLHVAINNIKLEQVGSRFTNKTTKFLGI